MRNEIETQHLKVLTLKVNLDTNVNPYPHITTHSLSSAFAPWKPISANVCGLLLLFPHSVGTGVLVVVGSTTPVAGAAEEDR